MPKCKTCPMILTWKTPYTKGDRPLGDDGKPHNCPNWQPKERSTKTGYTFGCDAPPDHVSYYFQNKKERQIFWCTSKRDEPNPDEWDFLYEKE